MKNYVITVLILLFVSCKISAQNEYKITTESVTWQGFSSTDAVVTAFLTITNTGSADNWYENVNGFSLGQKSSSINFKMVDIRKMLDDNSSQGSSIVSASISFLVPITADSLMLKYPERYGGKEIFLVRSYLFTRQNSKTEDDSEPYVSDKDLTRTTGKEPDHTNDSYGKHSTYETKQIELLGNAITLGAGFMETTSGNKYHLSFQGFLLTFKYFLYKFNNQNFALLLDLEWGGGGSSISGGSKSLSDIYLEYYGLDNKKYFAEPGHNSIFINYNVYGGPGLAFCKYKTFTPYCSFKIGYNWIDQNKGKLYNIENGGKSLISSDKIYKGLGFKFDFGIYFAKVLCLSYQFYIFKASNENFVLNSTYIGHFLNLSLGGY